MCLERLEQATALEPLLRDKLETDLSPEPALDTALWDRLEARLAEREAIAVATELLSVGPETSKLLLEGPKNDGDDDG